MKRRDFIKYSAISGSAIYFGFANPAVSMGQISVKKIFKNVGDGLWVRISEDNDIMLIVPSSEMGQGIHTSLAMVLAEELDADWNKIRVKTGSGASDYKINFLAGQLTGGSQSVMRWWEPLAKIGAGIRETMIDAAAKKWNLNKDELTTENSQVIHKASNRKINYGNLLDSPEVLEADDDAERKNPENYKLIGKPIKNINNPNIVTGKGVYGIDVQIDDLLIAVIQHAPQFLAKLKSYDADKALAVKGVRHVVPMDNKISVVADGYWQATKGLKALNAQFEGGSNISSEQIYETMGNALNERGKAQNKDAPHFLDVEYKVPYLAHTTMEPMNCTADVGENYCRVWAPLQAQTMAINVIEEITGFDSDNITLQTTLLGGGFGRRAETDFVAEAVTISKEIKHPVKLIWSREEDVQHDHYRPASLSRFQASIDVNGNVETVHNQLAGPGILKKFLPAVLFKVIDDSTAVEGAKELIYDFEHDFAFSQVDNEIPIGFWRSVGHSHNGFYVESFIDELANAVKKDPLDFRLNHLNDPRYVKVLQKLKTVSGWQSGSVKNRGVAINKSFGSIVGEVAEVELIGGKLKISKIYCVIDCGKYINPETIKDQVKGAAIYGLSAAVSGNIKISNGAVEQSNFHDYPALLNFQVPEIEVHIIENQEEPGGVGEPGTPPAAPALTNAIFALTGKRIRELPLNKSIDFV